AITSLALDAATSPATIYAETGMRNSAGVSYYGAGVLKSSDGGQTWTALSADGKLPAEVEWTTSESVASGARALGNLDGAPAASGLTIALFGPGIVVHPSS